MAERKAPEGNPANRRIDRPQDAQAKRPSNDATAASRLAVAKSRLGGELAEDQRRIDEATEALKRAAENERRS